MLGKDKSNEQKKKNSSLNLSQKSGTSSLQTTNNVSQQKNKEFLVPRSLTQKELHNLLKNRNKEKAEKLQQKPQQPVPLTEEDYLKRKRNAVNLQQQFLRKKFSEGDCGGYFKRYMNKMDKANQEREEEKKRKLEEEKKLYDDLFELLGKLPDFLPNSSNSVGNNAQNKDGVQYNAETGDQTGGVINTQAVYKNKNILVNDPGFATFDGAIGTKKKPQVVINK